MDLCPKAPRGHAGQNTNRTRTDHQYLIAWLYVRAAHTVIADAKRLDQRKRLRRDPLPVIQAFYRHGKVFAECAFTLHTHCLVINAAAIAFAAIEIGIARHDHARPDTIRIILNRNDLSRELMPNRAWIADIGRRTPKRGQVTPAHAADQHFQKRLSFCRFWALLFIRYCLPGLGDYNGFQVNRPLFNQSIGVTLLLS